MFESVLSGMGVKCEEVAAIRETIYGSPLRAAGAALGCSHQTVANRLTRAAARLGIHPSTFERVAEWAQAERHEWHQDRGRDLRPWDGIRHRSGLRERLTSAEQALEDQGTAILRAAGAL